MINGRSVYQKMSKEDKDAVKELQEEVNSNETGILYKELSGSKKITVYDIAAWVTPEEETL